MLNPGSKQASDQFTLLLSTADITVKLKNRGPDAYKKDVYGDSISIEHRISSDGCRTCRLKSKSGDFPPNLQTLFMSFPVCLSQSFPTFQIIQTHTHFSHLSVLYTFCSPGQEFSSYKLDTHEFYMHGTVSLFCTICVSYLHSHLDTCFSQVINVTELFCKEKEPELCL